MKILVGCETSNIVSKQFRERGHYVLSCDLLDNDEDQANHYKGDILNLIGGGWDLMIAHPPCTYLTVSANKWLKDQPPRESGALVGEERREAKRKAIEFFKKLASCNIPKICIENPIGCMSTEYRKPDQIIQPWMFGHGETKATCLWLKGLPKLLWLQEDDLFGVKTAVEGREQRIFKMPPSEDRWKLRSVTYEGIGVAMAEQWGNLE